MGASREPPTCVTKQLSHRALPKHAWGGRVVWVGVVAKQNLNKNNAEDIYDTLKKLKGSALKVAQKMSKEKNLMPQAYVEQFGLAQFSVPPLSGALVKKIIRKYLGDDPQVLFDVFSFQSENAASIGQVHRAEKNGKKLAIKIQYPGVSNSISSDLSIVKPIALKIFNLKGKDTEKYFQEVSNLNSELGLKDLSMGMSSDYELAVKFKTTFLRIGSAILGPRNVK